MLAYINEVTTGQISESASLLAIARINKWWGDKFIADITPANCRAYTADRKGVAIARTELSYLRAALRHWHKNHAPILIPAITMPDRPPARERWLTRSEAAAFLWAARRTPHIARFFIIGWYTGSRKTVILNLKWSMIDLNSRIARRKPAGAVQTKKRAPPFRVGGRLLSHLRRWKRMDGKQQLLIRFAGTNQGNALKQIDTGWNKARDAAKLPDGTKLSDDVTPHTLRHSRATHMMQQKVDVWEAAQFLGMSVHLLETTYGHHRPDWQTGAADAE